MNNKRKDPVEAEADMLQKSICATINSLPPKEKEAFYQAMASALRKAFNTDKDILKMAQPVELRHRLAHKSSFQALTGRGTKSGK